MSSSLKSKALAASGWVFMGSIGQQSIGFVISVVLARLLSPSEFGLIAMLAIFMALAQSLLDSGFGNALINKQDANHVDECSIFYFNLVTAGLLYIVLWFCAPLIAKFYREPILCDLSRFMGLNFIINGFGLIQSTLLRKTLNFRVTTRALLISLLVSGMIGITLAYLGFGVWSLAIQNLASNVIRTGLLWKLNSWRPSRIFSFTSLRSLFGYGSRLALSGILDTIFTNIYPLLIGRFYSPVETGYYARASSTQMVPLNLFAGVMSQVSFPLFSRMKEDPIALRQGYKRVIKLAAYICCPIMFALASIAKPLFLLLFTDKWLPAVPYFQLLCISGILFPFHLLNLNALMAVGRSDLFLRLEIFKKVLTVIALLVTCKYGIIPMIVGQIVNSVLALWLNTYYSAKYLDYRCTHQLLDLVPYLSLSAVMAAAIYGFGVLLPFQQVIIIPIQITIGATIYILLSAVFKLSAYQELMGIWREKAMPLIRRSIPSNV